MSLKKYFITFGGPTDNYHQTVNRICNETKAIGVFDQINGFTDLDLKNDYDFWSKHGDFIQKNPRGYGYWLWKSYLVNKVLNTMSDNEILVYADAGCSINSNGKTRLLEYFDIVNKSKFGFLSFRLSHLIKTYTKMDTIDFFDARDLLDQYQLVGGIFILRKCEHSVRLIHAWYEFCSYYHLIDDTPSIIPNDSSFIDHRHDQSVFTLLIYKIGGEIIDDETYFNNWNQDGIKYPIWATRKNN